MNSTSPDPNPLAATLYVARHGEVDAAWRRTVYGRLDVQLSTRGVAQSHRMDTYFSGLDLAFVTTSGLVRAETPAALIRASHPGLERSDDPRFLELDRGDWAGRSIDDLRAQDPAAFENWVQTRGAMRAPGGESPSEVAQRATEAFGDWAQTAHSAGKPGLIIAHLWIVRSAVATALGLPMEHSGLLALDPGGICELRWPLDGGAPDLVRYAI